MVEKWNEFEEEFRRRLDESKIPGAQVCIMDDTGVLYSKSFGFKDEAKTKPIDEETVFGIASMSKSVTCLAAALLEHEGKLSFDDPVTDYFPDFIIPGTPAESVLVRHLACHRTGLPPLPTLDWSMKWNTPDDPWEKEYAESVRKRAESKVTTVQDIIDYVKAGKGYRPLGQPGQFMSYLNDGYAVLSSVIDKASGMTLEEYVDKNIFEPLGMTHSTFDLKKVLASGDYTSLFVTADGQVRCSDIWDIAPPYRGCGWIKSTASDMARYYLTLSSGGMLEGKQVIPASCVEKMIGREFPETAEGTYCFGLSKHLFKDHVFCDHSGGLKGVSSRGGFIKGEKFSAAILTNLTGIDTTQFLNMIFNVRIGAPLCEKHFMLTPSDRKVSDPDIYVGDYRSLEDNITISVEKAEDGRLVWKEFDKTLELVYCGTTKFLLIPEGKTVNEGLARTFFAKDGKMDAVQVGSRIFQRVI